MYVLWRKPDPLLENSLMSAAIYRATHSIHLGQYERYIEEGTTVSWDGRVLKVDGENLSMTTKAFQACLRANWFVPISDTTTQYKPQPADVRIGPAQQAGDKNRAERMRVETVESDERVVGSTTDFRDHQKEMERTGGKRKMKVIASEGVGDLEPQEAEVIGKLRPAVSRTDVSSSEYHREMRRNSPIEGAGIDDVVERYGKEDKTVYTGDVSEPKSGADLADLFENTSAVVAHRQKPGVAGAGQDVHDGMSRVERLRAELAAAEAAELAAAEAAEQAAAEALLTGAEALLTGADDFILSDDVEVTSQVVLDAKFAAARSFLPDFQWDMSRHWRTRVADALKSDPAQKMAIMAVETDTVKRHILDSSK